MRLRVDDPSKLLIPEIALRLALVLVVVTLGSDIFRNDVNIYFDRAGGALGFDNLPYRDFPWEYPPLAALPLMLIPLTGGSALYFHVLFVLMMVALEYGSLVLLRRRRPREAWPITAVWTAGVVPLCAIAYFRLDLLPTFLATLAVIRIIDSRPAAAAVAAGFAAKLWPVVLVVPMLLRRAWRDVAVTLVACAGVLVAWYAFSPQGFEEFVRFRRGEGFQVESIPGSLLLFAGRDWYFANGAIVVGDQGFKWIHTVLNVMLVALPSALAAAWFIRKNSDIAAIGGALTLGLMLTTRLLSPQFLVWLGPFVALLFARHRVQGWLFVAASWLTVVIIEFYRQMLMDGEAALRGLLLVRNALLVVLLVELARISLRRSEADAITSDG